MLCIREVPVTVSCCTRRLSLGWFFSHLFFQEQLIMSLQLLGFQWCSREMKWHQPRSPGITVMLLSGSSDLTKRQWSRFHRSVLSFLAPEYWRRPGSSYRKKYYGFRANSWMRRRSVSSTKRWSDGCRNVCCCSPR